jgi:succinate dehydrogenase / fumarate reductase, cytochrome b subunit
MVSAVKNRPKYLDLLKIRLPVPGWVSILHRISGALLFLFFIPFLLAVLSGTLASAESFSDWGRVFSHPLAKLVLIVLAWAYSHHFFAGLRFLLLDLHKGITLQETRFWSKVVLWAAGVATVFFGVMIW